MFYEYTFFISSIKHSVTCSVRNFNKKYLSSITLGKKEQNVYFLYNTAFLFYEFV
jgi:hypothetical protein